MIIRQFFVSGDFSAYSFDPAKEQVGVEGGETP
jgi:hypothetical protein